MLPQGMIPPNQSEISRVAYPYSYISRSRTCSSLVRRRCYLFRVLGVAYMMVAIPFCLVFEQTIQGSL
jgi:hypothetical protein